MTSSSVSFVVEGPVPVEHRGKDIVISLKDAGGTVVGSKTLTKYTGAPVSSLFDNLNANTPFVLTVSENNTVLVSDNFTTNA